jgi:hypothetical protein
VAGTPVPVARKAWSPRPVGNFGSRAPSARGFPPFVPSADRAMVRRSPLPSALGTAFPSTPLSPSCFLPLLRGPVLYIAKPLLFGTESRRLGASESGLQVASEAEIEAQFKELGLPLGLIEHLQIAPAKNRTRTGWPPTQRRMSLPNKVPSWT